MKISYELYGKSFFHTDCIPGKDNGIIKPIKHEQDRSLLKCLDCKKIGYYPVGKIGEIEVIEQNKGLKL